VPSGLDYDEGAPQLLLRVQAQSPAKLFVPCIQGGREYAEIDNAGAETAEKHKAAKVSVPGYQDPLLPLGSGQHFAIGRLGAADLRCGEHIMTEVAQESRRKGVHILIKEELHEGTATWRSSTPRTSIAYWMQARMSSISRSG